MVINRRVRQAVTVLLLLTLMLPCYAKIYYSKNEALELAFGQHATVEMRTLFPDDQEIAQIEKLARVRLESAMFTFYVGKKGDKILGFAAIENHTVRTKPETLLVVLSTEGQIMSIHTLAFHEPPEYQPPQRWYQQLFQRKLSQLSFNEDIQGMSGATLSTRSALTVARKVMAVFQILVKDKQN